MEEQVKSAIRLSRLLCVACLAGMPIYATEYSITTVDYVYPNGTTTFNTRLTDINDSGQIVGYNSDLGGFEYVNSSFNALNLSYAGGINNSGEIVGTGYASSGEDIGIIINGSTRQMLTVPGSVRTLSYRINDAGIVVGYYTTGAHAYGFEYDGTNFGTISAPGSTFTFISGLNDSGKIVGEYGTPSNTLVQYLYDGSTFTPIWVPGSS